MKLNYNRLLWSTGQAVGHKLPSCHAYLMEIKLFAFDIWVSQVASWTLST